MPCADSAAPEGAAPAVWNTPVIVRGVLLTVVGPASLFCIGRWIVVPYLFALAHTRVGDHQPLSRNQLVLGRAVAPRTSTPIWAKGRRHLERFLGQPRPGEW